MLRILVQEQDFSLGEEVARLHRGKPQVGAVVAFVGLVRDLSDQAAVSGMFLEHYPGMTEKSLAGIAREAQTRWAILGGVIIHRIGALKPEDQIVLVAVSSGHRGDAFAACSFIMDYLKTQAPFWKRESTSQGPRWVEARAADEEAAGRWQEAPQSPGGTTGPLRHSGS
ncbi:MAG: molybdenum cofactor biosynthesis protein MoaE [Betaproteobacteria bacterium]|nr:molybdenum cofactor biosynthesis protein MoaE [Betaproteobacteria bacterium]